ncbi:MAG: diguanylate cyclase [Gemmatimonadaceae bacterium]
MTDRPTTERTALILDSRESLPDWFAQWCENEGLDAQHVSNGAELQGLVFRSRPRLIFVDGRGDVAAIENALEICARLKRDSFSGIVPLATLVPSGRFSDAFAAGADEVLRDGSDASDASVRMSALLRRSDRDTDVHPSTRLPGTREIGAELARRIDSRDKFAVCYADLDHFKEFNDRYSYYRGNQVIQLLARLLHDVVKGLCAEEGFVGHIGGDDFLYVVPIAAMPRVGDEVIRVFDELVPLQYSAHDQRVGYFFGKDRRGQLHKVPLMTLSVGVVTNQRRRFVHASEVSELATEMKSYAKTLPGSIWVVDRRRDEPAASTASSTHSASGSTVNETGKGASARTGASSSRAAKRSGAR